MPLLLIVLRDLYILILTVDFILGVGSNEGPARQVCGQRGGDLTVSQALGD